MPALLRSSVWAHTPSECYRLGSSRARASAGTTGGPTNRGTSSMQPLRQWSWPVPWACSSRSPPSAFGRTTWRLRPSPWPRSLGSCSRMNVISRGATKTSRSSPGLSKASCPPDHTSMACSCWYTSPCCWECSWSLNMSPDLLGGGTFAPSAKTRRPRWPLAKMHLPSS